MACLQQHLFDNFGKMVIDRCTKWHIFPLGSITSLYHQDYAYITYISLLITIVDCGNTFIDKNRYLHSVHNRMVRLILHIILYKITIEIQLTVWPKAIFKQFVGISKITPYNLHVPRYLSFTWMATSDFIILWWNFNLIIINIYLIYII